LTVFTPEHSDDKSEDNDDTDLEDKDPEADAISETSQSKDLIHGQEPDKIYSLEIIKDLYEEEFRVSQLPPVKELSPEEMAERKE